MSSVIVAGDTSGSVTLQAPAIAGSTVLTLPTTTGTLVVNSGAQTIEFADGSASAPSITNSGDTNTGIFFPAADTIAFSEGGVEAMRIDSAGNVGIGTTSAISSGYVTSAASSATYSQYVAADTQSFAANVGGEIAFSGKYNTAGAYISYGAISGLKENATDANPAGYIKFQTRNSAGTVAERMRLDSSGNLGLGVTPSTWTSQTALQVGGGATGASLASGTNGVVLASNVIFNSGWKYLGNGFISYYQQSAGGHYWGGAPSGTAGVTATVTDRMTLDTSGNLGLGVTPSDWFGINGAIELQNGGALAAAGTYFYNSTNAYYQSSWKYKSSVGGAALYTQSLGTHSWATAPSGTAGNAITFTTVMSSSLKGVTSINCSETGNDALTINHSAASPYPLYLHMTGAAPNNTTNYFILGSDTGGVKVNIRSNGGLANYSANNVNLSDRREKTNFAPAGNYLDKICAIPVQTFNYIDQNLEEDDGLTLGVVAQDVQAVCPEMVMESNWAGKEAPEKLRLSIYQTDLQYALMKSIQELKAIVDTQAEQIKALQGVK
jgi:hypothetical protein